MGRRRAAAARAGQAGRVLVALALVALVTEGCATGSSTAPGPRAGSPSASAPGVSPQASPGSSRTSPAASFDPALASALQADLSASLALLHYPALAAAVVMPDGSSWSGAAGSADFASGTPATADTSFAVASVTKTFVAALVLELVHDGALRLDDPISRWLPELRGDARFAADGVTVRELLDHTSGIAEYLSDPRFISAASTDPDRMWAPSELLAYVGAPGSAPGTSWAYSNTNYVLAGMVVERVTGSTVAAELRRRILEPLGLARTGLQPQERPDGPVAHGYAVKRPDGTQGEPVDPWDGSGLVPSGPLASAAWAAGGIASTAPDLARWAAALYGGRVLDAGSLAQMLDFGRNAGVAGGGGYGLGVVSWLGERGLVIGHSGGQVGFESLMWYLPRQRAAIVVLTNTDGVPLDLAYRSLERIVVDHLGG